MKSSNPSIKIISLNIERAKHLGLVLPYLSAEMPDVVCIQEIREPDIPLIAEAIGAINHIFAPMHTHPSEGNPAKVGVCIFTQLPVRESSVEYYRGNAEFLPHAFDGPHKEKHDDIMARSSSSILVRADAEKDGRIFRIATTHFMWSSSGRTNDYQREDIKKLLRILKGCGEFVLTGDFNSPRGGEIFGMLAEKYKDNVPAHYTTSIDGNFHRAGQLNLMVDGLFSTPGYMVSDVKMVCGLSDHCALAATVSKT